MSKINLSICMMVRNEEKNLRRCLESIKRTIMYENVELIIVDTGSKDDTVSIAREYTKRVYLHEWNNSFSEMRNVSISYAQGEWILILDADEEFENEEELIEMMHTDILKKYNTVQLILRNFTSYDTTQYSEISQMRFFRNSKEFKYQGTVHNQPLYSHPIYSNKKIILNHYGYNSQDKELMEKKYNRTKSLLLNELKKEPDNIYYRFQLAQTYYMHNDLKNCYDEIKYAYSLLHSEELKKLYGYVFQTYVNVCLRLNKYIKAVEVAVEGYSIMEDFIDLYFISATTKLKLGITDGVKEEVETYLYIFDHLNETEIFKNGSIEFYRVTPNHKDVLLEEYINYSLSNKLNIELDKINQVSNERIREKLLARYYTLHRRYNDLVDILSKNENELNVLVENELLKIENNERKDILTKLGNINTFYGLYNRFRIEDDSGKVTLFRAMEKNLNEIVMQPIYWDVLSYIFKTDCERFFNLLKKIESLKIKSITRFIINENKVLNDKMSHFLENKVLRVDDIHGNRVFYSMVAPLLIAANNNEKVEKYEKLFHAYIDSGVNFIKTVYNTDLIRLIYKTCDDSEIKLFMIFFIIKDVLNRKDYKLVLKLYKEAVQDCPFYSRFLELDIKRLEEKILN